MGNLEHLWNNFIHQPDLITWSTFTNTASQDDDLEIVDRYDFEEINIKNDIILNDESLAVRLARIEAALHIPTRNIKLEDTYPKLKKLWEQYNEELEKLTNWENIKNSK